MAEVPQAQPLPLFPLHTVLFPGGRLALKIFEARYLDMIAQALRTARPFGVVCLTYGREAGGKPGAARFESVGTLARIDEADAQQPGLLHLSCTGTQRFRIHSTPIQAADGLWSADIETLATDAPVVPPATLHRTGAAWAHAAGLLLAQGVLLPEPPWSLDDAGWVANRWSELLPMDLPLRQQLLEMNDPLARLNRVADLMRVAGFPAGDESALEDPGPATLRH